MINKTASLIRNRSGVYFHFRVGDSIIDIPLLFNIFLKIKRNLRVQDKKFLCRLICVFRIILVRDLK